MLVTRMILFCPLLMLIISVQCVPTDKDFSELEVFDSCPAGYSSLANERMCYKVNMDSLPARLALQECQNEGATLASVPNSFVNSYLYYIAQRNGAQSVYIGATCIDGVKSSCINDDGSNFGFEQFRAGEPNSNGVCVSMSVVGRSGASWGAVDCAAQMPSICQIEKDETRCILEANVVEEEADNCRHGYKSFGNACYKATPYCKTRSEAALFCEQENGFLAAIPNAFVNSFVNSLSSQIGAQHVWLGLECRGRSCINDDLSNSQYNNFQMGQPRYSSSCVSMNVHSTQWLSTNCATKIPFICQTTKLTK